MSDIKDAFSEGFRDGIQHGIRHSSEDFARVSPNHGIKDHWDISKAKLASDKQRDTSAIQKTAIDLWPVRSRASQVLMKCYASYAPRQWRRENE